MSQDIYRKLVDLYAGHELPLSVEEELESAAISDSDLAFEMRSLRETVDTVRESDEPEFTEEVEDRIFNRILMKQYGNQLIADQPLEAETSFHYQYQLPIRS